MRRVTGHTVDRRTLSARALGVAGLIAVCLAGGVLLPGSAQTNAAWEPPPTPPSTAAGLDTPGSATPSTRTIAPRIVATPAEQSGIAQVPGLRGEPGAGPAGSVRTDTGASGGVRSDTGRTGGPTVRASGGPGAPSAPSVSNLPAIAPAPATSVRIPAIGVDAHVLPVDSTPTGEKNNWGGDIYRQIDFPVDAAARQWVRRGDPNSLPAVESAGNQKAFDRVMIYGHASDIGYHLVFQDLSALRRGDAILVGTAKGTFTYRVTAVASNPKASLAEMAELYEYPKDGRKEIALVACLPDTTLNTVVLGVLVGAARR